MSIKKETLFVSFSGGRTSAYMCHWLLNNKADKYDFIFLFANTGQEHENTLKFVNQCDKAFGLNLVWLEAVVHLDEWKGCTHKVVTYETASRNGEPFEAVISKYGIPNPDFQPCNRELKINAQKSYRASLGFKRTHTTAIGYRADEIDRMNFKALDSGEVIYPLIKWASNATKSFIRHWWSEQDFDLEVDEHYGNCVTCWKKSKRKLMTIAKHEPERFDFFKRMEREHSSSGAGDGNRKFFRNYETCDDIIASSSIRFDEFVDYMPELQLTLDIDPLDIEGSCGASCEAV